jgi:hypothetical protein
MQTSAAVATMGSDGQRLIIHRAMSQVELSSAVSLTSASTNASAYSKWSAAHTAAASIKSGDFYSGVKPSLTSPWAKILSTRSSHVAWLTAWLHVEWCQVSVSGSNVREMCKRWRKPRRRRMKRLWRLECTDEQIRIPARGRKTS